VVVVYWFLHSSGDWFWAYPAISAPVFAWLGLGMRLEVDRDPSPSPPVRRPLPVAAAIAGVIAVAALSLALPWTAAVDVKRAAESWGSDPEAAFDRLDRAGDLNFLSAQPNLVAGAIATRLNDPERARQAFDRALERDPRNWYATLELAAIDALQGDRQSSLERLQRVAELNPLEPLTGKVRQGAVSGNPVSLEELDSAYLKRYCARQGRRATPTGCDPG
jgi:tetratricopeptide (TPR) repeat protein